MTLQYGPELSIQLDKEETYRYLKVLWRKYDGSVQCPSCLSQMLEPIPVRGIEGSVTGFHCPGCSFVSIGESFTYTPVLRYQAKRGQRLNVHIQTRMYGMLSDGMTPQEVAKRLGITVNTVYNYRRKFLNLK